MASFGFCFRPSARKGGEHVGRLYLRVMHGNRLKCSSVMTGNSVKEYAEKLAAGLEQGGHERTANAYRSAAKRFVGFNGGQDVNYRRTGRSISTGIEKRGYRQAERSWGFGFPT